MQKIRNKTINLRDRMGTRIYVLPNLLTTGNIFCGFSSAISAIQGNFLVAAYYIVGAAIFDLLDGRVARITRSTSKFGQEYDSLADLMSFGMAPAILTYQWSLSGFGRIGLIVSFLYLACTALRLARFNVQIGSSSNTHFSGLPSPMSAGIIASAVLCFHDMQWQSYANPWLLAMTASAGLVMVSNFAYRSFKDLDFRRRLPFHYLVIAVIAFGAIIYHPEVMLFALFITYATLGAIFGIFRWGRQPKRNPYLADDDDDDDHDHDDKDYISSLENDDDSDDDVKASQDSTSANKSSNYKASVLDKKSTNTFSH